MTCIFCDHLRPEQILYQTEHFKVVLDIDPIQPGHLLLIGKAHRMAFQDLQPDELLDHAQLCQKLSQLVEECLGLPGVSLVTNNHGVMDAGVHFHTHLIPRSQDDQFWDKLAPRPLNLQLDALLQEIKTLGQTSQAL